MATKGSGSLDRINALGISKSEFAERAGLDRGTLNRALDDDPKVGARTWGKIESTLAALEDELGIAAAGGAVTSTIEFRGARITMSGTPDDVAAAIRQVLANE